MTRVVGVVMGSDSDWPTMEAATEALAEFDVPLRGAGASPPTARREAMLELRP